MTGVATLLSTPPLLIAAPLLFRSILLECTKPTLVKYHAVVETRRRIIFTLLKILTPAPLIRIATKIQHGIALHIFERIQANSAGKEKIALICHTEQSEDDLSAQLFGKESLGILTFRYISQAREIAKTHSIQHLTVSSFAEIERALESASNRNWDFVWIRARGDSNGLKFGNKLHSKWELSKSQDLFKKKLGSNTTVLLESCYVGEGDSNFAQHFSTYALGATVYASSDRVNCFYGLELGKDTIPRFHHWFSDTTRIYRNGTLVT